MSRILLADDSPHAQRMGEFILREDGHEVVSVTDGETALVRLNDVDPDLILADVSLPGKSGYEICDYVKNQPKHHHVSVLLTAGAMEPIDEQEAQRVRADGNLRKPFEASVVLAAVKRLVEDAQRTRELGAEVAASTEIEPPPLPEAECETALLVPSRPTADPQAVRAAVTLAVEAALPVLIDEITQRVLLALAEELSRSEIPQAAESANAA